MLFDDIWSIFKTKTDEVDLDEGTALLLAPQLAPSQSAYFVVTVGDMITGWRETKDCYEAAQSSAATVSWHQYDDRADFSTGVENGVYNADATNQFDTHMQSPLYYTADYSERMTGFFSSCLA